MIDYYSDEQLNVAVATAQGFVSKQQSEGLCWFTKDGAYVSKVKYYSPTTDWEQAGVIMEQLSSYAMFDSHNDGPQRYWCSLGNVDGRGSTQLRALVIAFIKSKG